MVESIRMGLKPLQILHFTIPFTKVNGNSCINFNIVEFLLPSALADRFNLLRLNPALATFFVSSKYLI